MEQNSAVARLLADSETANPGMDASMLKAEAQSGLS